MNPLADAQTWTNHGGRLDVRDVHFRCDRYASGTSRWCSEEWLHEPFKVCFKVFYLACVLTAFPVDYARYSSRGWLVRRVICDRTNRRSIIISIISARVLKRVSSKIVLSVPLKINCSKNYEAKTWSRWNWLRENVVIWERDKVSWKYKLLYF